jgi:uncharacterized protein YpuA (DUF1002 family)
MGFRETYQELMEKQLNEWMEQSERFKAAAEKMQADARAQYERNLELLLERQKEAWANFYQLTNASQSAWGQFQGQMDKAGGEVKAAIERVTATFLRY